MKPAV